MLNALVTSPWTTNPINAASHVKFVAECKAKLLEPLIAKRDELRELCADPTVKDKFANNDFSPIIEVLNSIKELAYGIGALFSLFVRSGGDNHQEHIDDLRTKFDLTFDLNTVDLDKLRKFSIFQRSFATRSLEPGGVGADLIQNASSLGAHAFLIADQRQDSEYNKLENLPTMLDLASTIVDKFTLFLDEFLKAEPKPYNQEPS